ncbi:hypothetical protein [Desulfuribacillus alkaliarsenatis]|uniref:Uncharacterized protein n=1 Tax=Desulfuribacillus alkaliarsenatis TaxID=766136 RepID=A0A1E5G2N3_9FIRM|nr:hypothetical protein [Desulfuribacillus alkaliarsenatis]OEF97147.1 hypothetical protein BHF68_06000 [Desulfuribacillus alkaliarsenatis]
MHILEKLEIVELKKEIISLLHSLHFDSCYHIEDCILDLHKFLVTLDDMEISQRNLMDLNSNQLTKEIITTGLNKKMLVG